MNGGLLGQWGVWTSCAVHMLDSLQRERESPNMQARWLSDHVALTDLNSAIFDATNRFAGCIPGIMEVLRRIGLSPSNCCLDPSEVLSPGQSGEIDRVIAAYPEFTDNGFVSQHLDQWLAD